MRGLPFNVEVQGIGGANLKDANKREISTLQQTAARLRESPLGTAGELGVYHSTTLYSTSCQIFEVGQPFAVIRSADHGHHLLKFNQPLPTFFLRASASFPRRKHGFTIYAFTNPQDPISISIRHLQSQTERKHIALRLQPQISFVQVSHRWERR